MVRAGLDVVCVKFLYISHTIYIYKNNLILQDLFSNSMNYIRHLHFTPQGLCEISPDKFRLVTFFYFLDYLHLYTFLKPHSSQASQFLDRIIHFY